MPEGQTCILAQFPLSNAISAKVSSARRHVSRQRDLQLALHLIAATVRGFSPIKVPS